MERICKDKGHRNWRRKTGEECTCPKWVPASEYDALAAHVEMLVKTIESICKIYSIPRPAILEKIANRIIAEKQAEALDRLKELLKDTHMDKAPTVSRAAMHVDDAINHIKQECAPLNLRRQSKEADHD